MDLTNYYKQANVEGLNSLSEPYLTIIAINSAQAIIENGGFEYLFENFMPHREQELLTVANCYKKLRFTKESTILKKFIKEYKTEKDFNFFKFIKEEEQFFKNSDKIYNEVDKLEAKLK